MHDYFDPNPTLLMYEIQYPVHILKLRPERVESRMIDQQMYYIYLYCKCFEIRAIYPKPCLLMNEIAHSFVEMRLPSSVRGPLLRAFTLPCFL